MSASQKLERTSKNQLIWNCINVFQTQQNEIQEKRTLKMCASSQFSMFRFFLNPRVMPDLCSEHVIHVGSWSLFEHFIFSKILSGPCEPQARQIVKQRGTWSWFWVNIKYAASELLTKKLRILHQGLGWKLNLVGIFCRLMKKYFVFPVISRPGNFVVKLYFKYQNVTSPHGRQKENYITSKNISNSF